MENIDRNKYYKDDKEGFMIYLISRVYNDLQINTALLNAITDQNSVLSDNAKIYLFKLLISHLKEGLKILGIMKTSSRYNTIFNSWVASNSVVAKIITDISDELEDPNDCPQSINARYLEMRNEVFHYCIKNNNDFEYYKLCQKDMIEEKYDVLLKLDKFGKYAYEIGVDIPLTKNIFTDDAMNNVNELKNKVVILLKEILTDYYIKFHR